VQAEKGAGDLIRVQVRHDGDVRLEVLGQDEKSGRWARYAVVVGWARWNRLNAEVYNDREEIAQLKIEY